MKFHSHTEAEPARIRQLFESVFGAAEGPEEGAAIGALVADMMRHTTSRDIAGYIATAGGRIVGCILFTRMQFDTPIEAFILSPVAVRTDCQGKGVGRALINHGLEQLRDHGVELVFTYGDPDYYSRVGFRQIAEALIRAPQPMNQPQGWLCQSLTGGEVPHIPGRSRCVAALDDPRYW